MTMAADKSIDYLDGWADASSLIKRRPPQDPRRADDYNAGYSAALCEDADLSTSFEG